LWHELARVLIRHIFSIALACGPIPLFSLALVKIWLLHDFDVRKGFIFDQLLKS
jgi:hypothetical protein